MTARNRRQIDRNCGAVLFSYIMIPARGSPNRVFSQLGWRHWPSEAGLGNLLMLPEATDATRPATGNLDTQAEVMLREAPDATWAC